MICPFCLHDAGNENGSCGRCSAALPAMYRQYHDGRGSRSPINVSVIGYRGHGKTVYLTALFHILEKHLTRIWPGFFRQALNQQSVDVLHENMALLQQGQLPAGTRLMFPEPSIHRLVGMPRFGDRTVLLYDPPGEAFNADTGVEKYAHYVTRSQCVLLLISLSDMEPPLYENMQRLLETYKLGLSRLGAYQSYSQHLVVVYTKADLLATRFDLPHNLRDYLLQPEEETIGDLDSHIRAMYETSDQLADFTSSSLRAHGFVNSAQSYFRSVRYCAVSALGSDPGGQRFEVEIAPRHALDPLLWVLESTERRWFDAWAARIGL
jgi:hypothetical protein